MTRLFITGFLVAALVGCGIPLQANPQQIPRDAIPAPLAIPTPEVTTDATSPQTAEPVPSPQEPLVEEVRIWFVREDGLVGVETVLPAPVAPEALLQSLAVGPTPSEAFAGLRTVSRDPLTGLSLVNIDVPGIADETEPDVISVALESAFAALPPNEQVLLLGQVVLSLTGGGWRGVRFVDETGSPAAVPLPDGRLLDTPATARAYASLIVEL
jgi:hypothetical protein